MKQTWRWFGPDDPIGIDEMLQSGVQGVVTGLYDLAPGALWTSARIEARHASIAGMRNGAPSGLVWDVVESLPVSEAIKTGQGPFEEHINTYLASMENLAAAGIKTICYNFMPVLDWTRTESAMPLPNGGRCMQFDLVDFAVFDIFILGRSGAEADYSSGTRAAAKARFADMPQSATDRLCETVAAGLPGSAASFSTKQLREALAQYDGMTADDLRHNFRVFLKAVVPVAERLGLRLACHPDDPPWPILGLPRIVSTESDLEWVLSTVDSPANGLTFCTGSLGARADNDLPAMARRFSDRIHFCHFRNVRRMANDVPTSFFEDTHLGGSTDLVAVLTAILDNHPTPATLPMRPDHGQEILSDLERDSAPGYPLCGRMRGLAELRGVMAALSAAR